MSIAKRIQRLFHSFGLNLTRLPGNRFDAMPDVLLRLSQQGFTPTLVVDVGANRGQWASMLTAAYPDVPLHLVEPQTACHDDLNAFAARRGSAIVHGVALSKPDVREVAMMSAEAGNTGAHVIRGVGLPRGTTGHPATTLDELLGPYVGATDRLLLKLDVEGHELDVLAGATAILPSVDVLVSEVTFYDVEGAGNPTFLNYAGALRQYGFALYDFAALASRRRDGRLRMGDAVFVREGAPLLSDIGWA